MGFPLPSDRGFCYSHLLMEAQSSFEVYQIHVWIRQVTGGWYLTSSPNITANWEASVPLLRLLLCPWYPSPNDSPLAPDLLARPRQDLDLDLPEESGPANVQPPPVAQGKPARKGRSKEAPSAEAHQDIPGVEPRRRPLREALSTMPDRLLNLQTGDLGINGTAVVGHRRSWSL